MPFEQPFCVLCGDDVDPRRPGTYRKVEGWVENRTNGGAHSISMRRELNEFACSKCMTAKRLGFDANQGSLFTN